MSKSDKPLSVASKPLNEEERLAALKSFQLLDTLPEAALDHIAQAASEFCETKIALISLADSLRQWNKSSGGLSVSETPAATAFCAHAILEPDEFLEVGDVHQDSRFADDPLVTDHPNIRFYAGIPLNTSDGHSLGTLCVIDDQPRNLTPSQKEGLKHLSSAVTALFEECFITTSSPLGIAIDETLNNGIVITDAAEIDNPIIYCNQGFMKLCGYDREEIIGKNLHLFEGEDTDPAVISRLRDAITYKEECTVILKFYRKDGTPFWNKLSISPIRNNKGIVTHFIGIQQDITEQRAIEERVILINTVLEESLNEIYIFDEKTLNFILVNHGARLNLGYSMEELLGMSAIDIKPEFTNQSFKQKISPLLNEDIQKIEFSTVHKRKDGSTYPVEVHLQKMHFNDRSVLVAFILDITERTHNKLKLDEANMFLDSAPDATVIVDELGRIQFCNQQMSQLLGYSYNELHEMNVDELVPNRFRDSHAAHRASFGANPKVRGMGTEMELSAITKDGREIPIEVSLSPIDTVNGKLVAAAIRDISARKATEKALHESEEQLREAKEFAEKTTAAKSRFLAAASHDLRQPLQALRLYLSALKRNLNQPKQLQLSEKMDLSLDTMGELLDALLDISTLESGSVQVEKKDVYLSDVLERIVAANAQQAKEKGLEFVCADATDCVIHTDPVFLERIIENFITNAIRYTEQGSIRIQHEISGDVVHINVSDTGTGIPDEELTRIFDEFYQLANTVRDRSKGLGLGLSIVKHIARLLDHPINATSVLGKGSNFSIEVPLGVTNVTKDEIIKNNHQTSFQHADPIILIVDDDVTIVDAMNELLTAFKMKVVTATSCVEALNLIQNGLKPDIVVSDYRMPVMTGIELVKKIRIELNEDVPVVIMTGDNSSTEVNEAELANSSVLYKPINTDQFMALINSLKP